MNVEYRQRLLAVLSKLDWLVTETQGILDDAPDVEIGAWAEDLREMQIELLAKVEAKLDAQVRP